MLLAALPYFYLRTKRSRRLAAFEEQFPEALDFLARSMRAGHAFTISLRMASEDLPDPLGLEFRTLFNEQNLRERFRLKGQVKAASAHGRVTALVLSILPAVTAILMMLAAPAYLRSMLDDPDGKKLIAASIVGQVVGQLVIRKIIRIKV